MMASHGCPAYAQLKQALRRRLPILLKPGEDIGRKQGTRRALGKGVNEGDVSLGGGVEVFEGRWVGGAHAGV